jgi:hypothetical protein
MQQCQFCQRTFSNSGGLGAHRPYCQSNPDKVQRKNSPNAHAKKGSTGWSKGLTKESDPRVARPTLMGKKFGSTLTGHSLETKRRLSDVAKDRGLGGYIKGSGRGKKGWYKGFFCDSSYELAYVIYCLDHKIQIERNTTKRLYEFEGKTKTYIPDFLVEGELVEIKGYKSPEWEAKLAANSDVKVLYEKDLTEVFSYVEGKYGKKYIELYESS